MADNLATVTAIANQCLRDLGMSGSSVKSEQLRGLVHALRHKDLFICLPTGFGKSFCFQAFPLASEKMGFPGVVVLVVSPLVGLSGDQVRHVNKQIADYAIHITSPEDIAKAEKTKARLMYVSPELLVEDPKVCLLLNTPHFKAHLELLVFDEVHCVASWGATFRTAYDKVDSMLSLVPHRSVMALTATATRTLMASLSTKLRMDSPVQIVGGSLNPAIHLSVRAGGRFLPFLGSLVAELKLVRMHIETQRTFVFFTNLTTLQDTYSQFTDLLPAEAQYTSLGQQFQNSRVGMFHSHTLPDIKAWVLDQFADPNSHLRVIFASSAFGLGIDAQGIDRVVHHSCPTDVDEYVQEIGRGGRGGGQVEAILFDTTTRNSSAAMVEYMKGTKCRRQFLCKAMDMPFLSPTRCCDVCDKK